MLSFLAVRRPADRTHLRADLEHRRDRRPRRVAPRSGSTCSRRWSRSRSPSSPASAGTSTGRCRSASRRTTTISRLWFNLGLVGLVMRLLPAVLRASARARRASLHGRAADIAAQLIAFVHRRHRRVRRGVLRRPARSLVLLLDVRGRGDAPGAVRATPAGAGAGAERRRRAAASPRVARDPYGWAQRAGRAR